MSAWLLGMGEDSRQQQPTRGGLGISPKPSMMRLMARMICSLCSLLCTCSRVQAMRSSDLRVLQQLALCV